MIYIVLIGASLILLGGFLVLVMVEQRAGTRVLATWRRSLDRRVRRAAFIATHVDWAAFTRDLTRSASERVLHDTAHSVLRMVRTLERMLTRAVKRLRERRGIPDIPEESEARPRNQFVARATRMRDSMVRTARKTVRRNARRSGGE